MQVLLRQAKIIDAGSEFHNKIVDILVVDGVIKTISGSIDVKADKLIEGKGLHVSTGWVDLFADYREPGFEHKETITSGLDAARAGGFTQVLVLPNTNPSVSTRSGVQYLLQRASGHEVKLQPMGSVTQDIEGKNLSEMMDMRSFGAVAFTDGWKPVQNPNLMMKALEYVKAFEGVVVQLPVDTALSAGGLMHEGTMSVRLGIAGAPVLAETLIIHRDIELLRYTDSKLHITGVSSAAGVEMIRKAKAEGLKLTCSVTPYHLALTDESLSTYDSLYKVTPPLRTEEDRLALIAGLADGTVDCVASHHRPQEWDAKAKEFEYASDGIALQQYSFQVAYEAVKGKVSLDRLVDAFAVRAREIFGLEHATLKEGAKAELTVFSTEGADAATNKSLSSNNPFLKNSFTAQVEQIIAS